MATIKSFTDLPQSKKLAEFLPIESADMCYIAHSELINIHEPFYKKIDKDDTPCWSLAALIDTLPRIEGIKPVLDLEINYVQYPFDIDLSATADNPVDACVAMIESLHELNLL